MPKCRVCNGEKPPELFVKNQRFEQGHENICKSCKVLETTSWRKRNPYVYKAWKFKTSPEVIQELLETQTSCQICGTSERRLVIDHDHGTMKIRGVLCHVCNTGIGAFKDNHMILRRAVSYLEDHLDEQH